MAELVLRGGKQQFCVKTAYKSFLKYLRVNVKYAKGNLYSMIQVFNPSVNKINKKIYFLHFTFCFQRICDTCMHE